MDNTDHREETLVILLCVERCILDNLTVSQNYPQDHHLAVLCCDSMSFAFIKTYNMHRLPLTPPIWEL